MRSPRENQSPAAAKAGTITRNAHGSSSKKKILIVGTGAAGKNNIIYETIN
jgi:hypothetical protein